MLAVSVPGDAALTLRSCRFATVANLDAAESDLALGAFGAAFLGLDGTLVLEDCHMLFTATVRPGSHTACRMQTRSLYSIQYSAASSGVTTSAFLCILLERG